MAIMISPSSRQFDSKAGTIKYRVTNKIKHLVTHTIQHALLVGSFLSFVTALSASANNQRIFEYQQAAAFTHLNWPAQLQSPYKVRVAPIENFSGIAIEDREERADYYLHGNFPSAIHDIFLESLKASRHFDLQSQDADYQLQLTIESYQLPFDYTPDNTWWEALQNDTDRWLQAQRNASIRMHIKLTSLKRTIKPWLDSVTMVMSPCDLNKRPQPITGNAQASKQYQHYLQTTPGQAYLAGVNFLIWQTVNRLNQEIQLGQVVKKFGHSVYLQSDDGYFLPNQKVDLYYHDALIQQRPAGALKIVHADNQHALAFPMNLRVANIKVGDKVGLGARMPIEKPSSIFQPALACAEVITAEATKESSSNDNF